MRWITPAGPEIKAARLARNWSQEELAKEAGISYKTVWKAENGHNVRLATLQVIANALDLSRTDLEIPA